MAGMSSLTVTYQINVNIQAANNITGADYSPNQNKTSIAKSLSIGTAAANAAVGGADEVYSAITTIAPSGSVSIDLTSIADLLATAGVSLARVKAILLRLLNATDDATNGTAASSITVDGTVVNGLISQTGSGWLTNATSKFDVPSGGFLAFGTPAAGGLLVDGTHKIVKLTNNDGALSAKAQLTIIGGSN